MRWNGNVRDLGRAAGGKVLFFNVLTMTSILRWFVAAMSLLSLCQCCQTNLGKLETGQDFGSWQSQSDTDASDDLTAREGEY